ARPAAGLPVSSALPRRDAGRVRAAAAAAPAGGRRAVSELLSLSPGRGAGVSAPLLEVRDLKKYYPIQQGYARRVVGHVRAVDDVSFVIQEGETLGLVGESGCGKTTTARCILRAMAPTAGQLRFRTRAGDVVDLAPLSRKDLRPLRPQIQMIFQDPFGSLN